MALLTERQDSGRRPTAYDDRPRTRRPTSAALGLFLAAALGVALTAWIALGTALGQRLDEQALRVLTGSSSVVNDRLIRLLEQVNTGSVAVALAIMIGIALVRGRFRVALAAVVLVAGANVTTQLLKHDLLVRPNLGNGGLDNTLPSGHTTVVFSLVLAAVLVAPRALRAVVAFGGAAVGALTGLATVIAGWHRPSDVVAGLLVTLAWAALVSAFIAGGPRDGALARGGPFPALLGGTLAALGVIIYGFGWSAGPDVSRAIPLTAAVIAGVAAACVGSYATLVARSSN
ncbi:MAG: phosphatase PAP2 family protein [Microlunatus sp.]|nr:phosphatase PAP2 family protein [Microlunatus sp.]